MNAIMNEKGRQTKLLAAIAVLAMVICVLAAVVPSGVNATEETVANELPDANESGVIELVSDTTLATGETINGQTLDLNGKTLTITSGAMTFIGNAKVIDGTIVANGTNQFQGASSASNVTFDQTGGDIAITTVSAGSNVSFTGCTFTGTNVTTAIYVNFNASPVAATNVEITKCVINTGDASVREIIHDGPSNGNITITDSTDVSINVCDASSSDPTITYGKDIVVIGGNIDRLNVNQGCTFVIPEGKELTVDRIRAVAEGEATITVAGTLSVLIQNDFDKTLSGDGNITTPEKVTSDEEIIDAMADPEVEIVTVSGSVNYSGAVSKPINVVENGTLTTSGLTLTAASEPINVVGGTVNGIVKNGNNTANFSNVKGTYTISYGSIAIDGTIVSGNIEDISNDVTISGSIDADSESVSLSAPAGLRNTQSVTMSDDLAINTGTLSIGDGLALIVPEGTTLTIASGATLTVNGGIAVYGKVIGTISGTGDYAVADSADVSDATFGNELSPVSIFTFENATGLNQNLEANYTVTSKAFLEKDLTINEGVTLSIANGATLDLNGYTLTVLGTLEVAGNGSIDSSIADGTIALGARAVVNNSGVIGSTNAVSVELSLTIASVDGRVIVPGAVDLKNVTGVSFGYKRVVSDDVASYYLTISGSAAKKGTVNGTIAVSGTVYTGSEFTIGNRVTLTGSTLVVDQNAVMTVSTNGVLGNNTVTSTVVDLLTGATLNIDGAATATISADTGDYNANVTGTSALAESSVKLTNVKGIVLTVTSEDYTEKNVLKTAQRLDMSGALDNAADGDAKVEIGGTANETNFVGVVVSDTLTVNKDITTWTVDGAKFTVTGTVSYTELADGVDLTSNLEGAVYTVQNEVNGARVTTTYITSFASAVANIANVYETMIEVYGDTVEIETGFELGVDQIINMGDGQTVEYTIPSDVEVTIGNDATFNATKITVEGVLIVMVDGYTDADLEYAVYSEDDIGNRIYSGFKVALDNAQPGDVITIDKTANVTEDVIIPAQVTVNITDTGELNVKADSNGNPSDLTVEGTLNNEGVLTVTGDMTVTGTADLTEGVTNSITGDVSVTGTMTTVKSFAPTGEISAVRYTNEDGYYVYTDITKAVAAVSAFDVNRNMELVGTVSDNSAVTLTDMTLTVTGTARMGTITLDGSSVVVNGTFTGTIAGQSGEEGSTAATAVTLTSVKGVTVESDSSANESNVQVFSTVITLNTEGANANTYLVGDISIDAGTVNLGSMSVGITGAPNNTESTISVTSGATAVIGQGVVINAGADAEGDASVIITGTLQVRGTFNVNGVVDVAGTMNIAKTETADQAKVTVVKEGTTTGVLNISGAVTVSEENNLAGTLEVNNIMAVSGSVSGPVALGESGYLKAYATATLNDAKIDWNDNTSESEADVTAFYINGEVYMTI